MPTEVAAPEFCLFFANILLQLVNKGEIKKVKNITRLIFDANCHAGELRRHVNGIDSCKQKLDENEQKGLPGGGFLQDIVRIKSGSSVPGSVLYEKDVCVVLRREMAIRSSQDVLSARKLLQKRRRILCVCCTARLHEGRCERE